MHGGELMGTKMNGMTVAEGGNRKEADR